MFSNRFGFLVSFAVAASAVATSALIPTGAVAFECHSYEEISAKLGKKYGEQIVFNGFADSQENGAANEIYEFWANPKHGNWSLIARKIFLFQHENGVFNKSCASIVNSGKRYYLSEPGQAPIEQAHAAVGEAANSSELTPNLNCIPRDRHAKALLDRYNETPFVHALTEDDAIVEIYGSQASWTITQAKIREVRNTMTGLPIMDAKTGQQIHQLCSDPAYSGKTWGVFALQEEFI